MERDKTWMAGSSPAMTATSKSRSHQQINQMRDQRNVRGRHRIIAQLVGADPGQLLALARDHHAFPAPADVERHQQMKVVIGVARKSQRRQAWLADVDADLFMQLADQRLLRPFAGLDLAARKLPQARERLALRALCDQHALVDIDQGTSDDESELDVS